jgi:hypothetical protein
MYKKRLCAQLVVYRNNYSHNLSLAKKYTHKLFFKYYAYKLYV